MTTQSPPEPTGEAGPPEDTGTLAEPAGRTGKPRLTGPLRRLLFSLLPANIGIFLLWGAIPGILLPLQVEAYDKTDKAANLAIVTTIGAFAAMFAQPLAGMLSDRTRSRYGRRAPWLVCGAFCGGLALLGMAAANTLVQIAVAWTVVQIAYNFVQGPLSAVMPDRVPPALRGTFSAVAGCAAMIGAVGGQVAATGFASHIGVGYVIFAGFALITSTLLVVFNPDEDNRAQGRRPFSLAALGRSFSFDPRRHPDFAWAFLGRFLLYLGYFVVANYQLYILQEYIGLGDDAVTFVPVLGLTSVVFILISTLVGGPLSDRLGRRKVLIYLGAGLCGLGLMGPWALPTRVGILLFAAVTGFGFGLFQSVDTALVSEVLPAEEDAGKDLGVINIAATLPQVLGPAVAGGVVVALGYSALFPVAATLMVLGGLAVAPIKRVR